MYNFPDTPGLGQLFTPPGGPTWVWSNGAWVQTEEVDSALIGAQYFESVAQASASPIDPSLETIHLTGYYNAGDSGDALYKKVGSAPTHQAKFQSADGAWWEIVLPSGEIRIEQIGGRADSTNGLDGTDNLAALTNALEVVSYVYSANYIFGPIVRFGVGGYRFSGTIDLRRICTLIGAGSGLATTGGASTNLYFPAETHGIIVNQFNTDASGVIANTTASTGTLLQGLRLVGVVGGADRTKRGIWGRSHVSIKDCFVSNFPGDGIALIGFSSGVGEQLGNVNGWYIERTAVQGAGRHGLFVSGSDANAGAAVGFQCRSAAGCGIYDRSGLGNTYIGPQVDAFNSNGLGRVQHLGLAYMLISEAVDIGKLTTPGTQNGIWYLLGPAGSEPAWSASGTYEPSMPIFITSGSNRCSVVGPYTEGGVSHAGALSVVTAGQAGFTYYSMHLRASQYFPGMVVNAGIGWERNLPAGHVYGTNMVAGLGGNADLGNILATQAQFNGSHINRMRYFTSGRIGFTYDSTEFPAFGYTIRNTTETFGKATTPVEGAFFANRIALGNPTTGVDYRLIYYGTAAPTTGEHAAGEIVFDISPTAGSFVGWVCTAAGTPGTWKTFGVITA